MSLYDSALANSISAYTNAYLQPLGKYKNVAQAPTDLASLISYNRNINKLLSEVRAVTIQPLIFDAVNSINSYYDNLQSATEAKRNALQLQYSNKKQEALSNHEQEVAAVKQYNASLTVPMERKHKELLDMKDKVKPYFEHYGITPLDIELSDNLTPDEFNLLIDEAIKICNQYVNSENTLIQKVLNPLKDKTDLRFTATYTAVGVLLTYFALPLLMPLVFVKFFKSTHTLYQDLEKLRIAYALMSQIDYKRFVTEDSYKTIDETIDVSHFDEELSDALANVEDYTEEKQKALDAMNADNVNIQKKCKDAEESVRKQYSEVINKLTEIVNATQKEIEKLKSEYVAFPNKQHMHLYMNRHYVLGKKEDAIDVSFEMPAKNIVFDSKDRFKGLDNLKLYLCNALLSVRVRQLIVEIYDPKNMCADLVEFFNSQTKDYIMPNEKKLDKLIEEYRKYTQDNIIALGKRPIDDYNREAEEKDMLPKGYRLLIILSDFDKYVAEDRSGGESEQFREFLKFSALYGVMVWILDTKPYADCLFVDGNYTGEGKPIQYMPSIGKEAVYTYIDALSAKTGTSLDYFAKYNDVFIKRENWWKFDTIEGIKFCTGLADSDPTRGLKEAPVIGDRNVHTLMGGMTGSGKSAAIDVILASLVTMYPPSELNIVYIDFKAVEAQKYSMGLHKDGKWNTPDEELSLKQQEVFYRRYSRIPHLQIISGTTDGEYALSVFEFLMQEMQRRQQIINKAGCQKIQDLREKILKKYNLEHNGDAKKGTWFEMRQNWDWYKANVVDIYGELPRLLITFDEFQVMYNTQFVPQKIIDEINGKITAIAKLARAMGAHFWFTSQSMKGTMSKDTMGNFSLRAALSCQADISTDLVGDSRASRMPAKVGYIYTNENGGTDPSANKIWRMPYFEFAVHGQRMLDELNEMCITHNEKHRMAELYDEKTLVPVEQLKILYEKHHSLFAHPNTFILGERANYSTNKAPVAFKLREDMGENISICAPDPEDFYNIVSSLIQNLKCSDDNVILLNTRDSDSYTMLQPETFLQPGYEKFATNLVEPLEFLNIVKNVVDKRSAKKEADSSTEFKPCFVFLLMWERVDLPYKDQDVFKAILRAAPLVGVHFVICCREKLDMQRFIPAACNHKIGCSMSESDTFFFMITSKASKLPPKYLDQGNFGVYEFDKKCEKFKLYNTTFEVELESREVVITEDF